MPLTSSASDVIGIVTLVLVGISCCLCVCGLAYVLLFHFRVVRERQPLLRDFDSPWIVRLVLICLSILWSVSEILRLPFFREKHRYLHEMSSSTQENMCRFHVVWSIGLIEPGLLLTVLFLVQGSLQEIPRNINNRILLFSALLCFPVFIIQFSLAAAGHRLSSRGLLPSYFTRPYKVIDYEDNDQIILCSYSLLSLLALALFTLIFIWFFAQFGYRIVCHVINRKLRSRIYWLLVSVIVMLPLHVVLLGVTVKIDPSRTIHEVLTFTGFLALLFCVATALGVLVFLPIADAIDAHYSFRRRNWSWQSFRASPIEPFGRPSLTGLSDNEDPMNQGGSSLLLGALSSTDVGSSSREASLTFDTTVKELTLGPGGWLVDIPGSIAYPPSPVFPERPLTLL